MKYFDNNSRLICHWAMALRHRQDIREISYVPIFSRAGRK